MEAGKVGENYYELPQYPDLNIKKQNEIYDAMEEAGTILNQDPEPGTQVEKGRTILVTVSLGQPPKEATMIDFTQNYDPVSAKAYLDGLDMGLKVDFLEEFNDEIGCQYGFVQMRGREDRNESHQNGGI